MTIKHTINSVYRDLTVIQLDVERSPHGHILDLCQCVCGVTKPILRYRLTGNIKPAVDCGHRLAEKQANARRRRAEVSKTRARRAYKGVSGRHQENRHRRWDKILKEQRKAFRELWETYHGWQFITPERWSRD